MSEVSEVSVMSVPEARHSVTDLSSGQENSQLQTALHHTNVTTVTTVTTVTNVTVVARHAKYKNTSVPSQNK